jgi:D-beta-D-heptose 7-phosphate kinase/D-beta-D-heptose 1-phosphate adenosyltransferase
MIRVCVSGGFDPLHVGHIDYIREARVKAQQLHPEEDIDLTVLLNSDAWLTRKKGRPFMKEEDRAKILASLIWVDQVVIVWDRDGTVVEGLRQLKPDYFAKGGDRTEENTPEKEFCEKSGIGIIWGCGNKIRSSQELLNAYKA